MTVTEKLAALRQNMEARGLEGCIVVTDDFHGSEYVGAHFKAREFLSGFTGSAGTLTVLREGAYLWTDGRYFLQAERQLEGSGIQLMRAGQPGVPTLSQFLAEQLPEGGALCAVSGGLDSMCLLEMTVRQGQKQGRRVAAAHFNHQLRGAEADRDEAFVRDWCAAREIPFFAGRGDVRAFAEKTGRTVEEAARQLRYEFLEETRRREGFGCILTAHHADDSAETMLLNLLRGTGLKGLTGIPEKRDCILRPLLSVTRAELAAYAAEHRIPFVEDSTNGTDDAARNVLRHQVLPVLRQLNPRAVENMSRAAELLRQLDKEEN